MYNSVGGIYMSEINSNNISLGNSIQQTSNEGTTVKRGRFNVTISHRSDTSSSHSSSSSGFISSPPSPVQSSANAGNTINERKIETTNFPENLNNEQSVTQKGRFAVKIFKFDPTKKLSTENDSDLAKVGMNRTRLTFYGADGMDKTRLRTPDMVAHYLLGGPLVGVDDFDTQVRRETAREVVSSGDSALLKSTLIKYPQILRQVFDFCENLDSFQGDYDTQIILKNMLDIFRGTDQNASLSQDEAEQVATQSGLSKDEVQFLSSWRSSGSPSGSGMQSDQEP